MVLPPTQVSPERRGRNTAGVSQQGWVIYPNYYESDGGGCDTVSDHCPSNTRARPQLYHNAYDHTYMAVWVETQEGEGHDDNVNSDEQKIILQERSQAVARPEWVSEKVDEWMH